MTVQMSKKGRIVIPSELRKKYNMKPGSKYHIIDYGGILAIVPIKENVIEDSTGVLARSGKSLTQALQEEHQQERLRESNPNVTLEELLAKINPENVHGEIDWGNPTGDEAW